MFSPRYYRFIFAFFMSFAMSLIMSGVLAYINLGLVSNFFMIWLEGSMKAFVVAYPCVLFIAPIVAKATKSLTRADNEDNSSAK